MPVKVDCDSCDGQVEPSRVVNGARTCKKCARKAGRGGGRGRRIRMSQAEFDAFIRSGRGAVSGEVMR